jgi:hypothetical protein
MDYDIHPFVASSSTEDMPPCPMSSFPADMSAASEQQTYQQIDELDAELILLEQLINENQAAIQHLVQLDQKEQAMLCDLKQSVAHLQQEVRGVGAVFKPSMLSAYPSSHHARYLYRQTRPDYPAASHSYRPRYSERVGTSAGQTVGWRWRSKSSFDPRNRRSVHCMYDSSWAGSTDSDWCYHRRHVANRKRTGADQCTESGEGPRR